jgi:hypothetical protein
MSHKNKRRTHMVCIKACSKQSSILPIPWPFELLVAHN